MPGNGLQFVARVTGLGHGHCRARQNRVTGSHGPGQNFLRLGDSSNAWERGRVMLLGAPKRKDCRRASTLEQVSWGRSCISVSLVMSVQSDRAHHYYNPQLWTGLPISLHRCREGGGYASGREVTLQRRGRRGQAESLAATRD